MPEIALKGISNFILNNIHLTVRDRELLVLLGPNGAGKTTLLNTIAGFTTYNGLISFNGNKINAIPTRKRGIGYLFQDLALFPHLDVFTNISFSLKIKKVSQNKIISRVGELLGLMRIEHLKNRYPKDLSGGERQKVALARALASSPEILLLDEPLAGLDLRTSKNLRIEFHNLQRKLGITTIYVTHDQNEAEEMADRIVILYNGKIEQIGTPYEIFFAPMNEKVMNFIGEPNILTCEYCNVLGNGLIKVECGGISITAPHDGDSIRKIAIAPAHVHVYKDRPPGPDINRFNGKIVEIIPLSFIVRFKIKVKRNIFIAELPHERAKDMNLKVGEKVFLLLKLRWIKTLNERLLT
ncbi:MAG: ABC transporter ATP-binding protein [Thermodesulfobacteriota bacterium]|nr:ABC transporter ATP-binding protein [Thermodesulfobacteriota bacterium]